MATLLVPDLFHAEMTIPGFDPFRTSSATFRVIAISSAMSILCMFGMRSFTSPYKPPNQDTVFDSKRKKTGTKSVATATSKYVPYGVFLRVQYWCQVSITLLR